MIERGEGWEMHLGDCISWMKEQHDRRFDHIIADPPYEAEAHTKQRRVKRGDVLKVEPLSFAPITAAERADAGWHISRLTRRWALVFCQVEAAMLWRDALCFPGTSYRRTCIWNKPDGMPQLTGDRPAQGYESLVAVHAPGSSTWNGGGKRGVFTHSARWSGGTPHDHPTEKPIDLMLELVELFTDAGETIFDPYAGSGTTGVAALRRGRRFVGVELDAKHFATCVERLRAEESGSTLQAQRAGQAPLFGSAK